MLSWGYWSAQRSGLYLVTQMAAPWDLHSGRLFVQTSERRWEALWAEQSATRMEAPSVHCWG